MDINDGEPAECFRVEWRRARVSHRCCECGRTIARGERYEVTSGIWDHEPERYKTCAECVEMREVVVDITSDDGTWMFGCVAEQAREGLRELLWATRSKRVRNISSWLVVEQTQESERETVPPACDDDARDIGILGAALWLWAERRVADACAGRGTRCSDRSKT